ncbi:MAG: hypothetical protein QXU32_13450 [Nitrososphaerales archaeon]
MLTAFSALLISSILLSTLLVPASATYVIGYPKLKPTKLMLDPLPECKNDLQCNATFLPGHTITFTGMLTDSDERFIPDATINIYRFVGTQMHLLTSAVTERDGTFEARWQTQFMDQKVAGETFKQQMREVSTLFAKYEGDETYAASQSGKIVITVRTMDLLTHVATDKKLYRSGENALIFINFIEIETSARNINYGKFVDPSVIRVTYDGETVELSRKKEGSYVFITPPLTAGHHQLIINPAKEGYNSNVGFITVQVSGFFGK